MSESAKKFRFFSAEMIMSYSAVLVGLCALAVSIYEANIFRNQQKASVWPFIEFSYSNTGGFNYNIQNKGVGPAIIKWVIVEIDGIPIQSWKEYNNFIAGEDSLNFSYNTSFINGRVISANETIRLIHFTDEDAVQRALLKNSRISFKFCYSSIFDDKWILEFGPAGTEISRVKNDRVDPGAVFQN